jgi:hypothetical protein
MLSRFQSLSCSWHGQTGRHTGVWVSGCWALSLLVLAVSFLFGAVPSTAAAAEFGIEPGSFSTTLSSARAGEHADLTTSFRLNLEEGGPSSEPVGAVKDIKVDLPPGQVGDPNAVPQCSERTFQDRSGGCPIDSQVGVVTINERGGFSLIEDVYNVTPRKGETAALGFSYVGQVVHIAISVRSGSDYGLTATISNISEGVTVTGSSLTIWGVPADPSHDALRGAECGVEAAGTTCFGGNNPSSVPPEPYLTSPTFCSGQLSSAIAVDSWEEQGDYKTATAVTSASGLMSSTFLESCDRLAFKPSITVAPDTLDADTPAGLTFDLHVPQDGLLSPSGLATADIRDAKVVLPPGVVINPGQAAGLVACPVEQDGVGTEGPSSCPNASQVGTVSISTPLLPDKLEGNIYILPSNPPNLQLLVAASADGVNIKLIGEVHLDGGDGQLTATFGNTPQLPFTDFKLSFSGGAQAALATPVTCGVYTTNADFTPWSAPAGSDALVAESFGISSGPGGSSCVSPLPFVPSMIAGSTTDQAGGYTSFSLLLQRSDGQQRISTLQFKTPEGLLGMISKVPLCGEPEADQGTCPSASQIGHTIVQAGPGPYPLAVPQPGQAPAPIYLTGPYKGAPYGLAIAVPIIAGPFNLGTVVVRASIAVDPHTSQLTITTDPLPSILDGVPTDLRTINAVIDRPGFMFNPTSCARMSFGGTATSTEGSTAPIAAHFQVGSCQSLTFKPKFAVSTSGKTSRKAGASLDAKIVYPSGALGANQASSQANIASVKVDLPKQLPSRLTTLQKACTAAQFEANPAGCPEASLVGHATAKTPVLPVELTGPVYFVSHGGEAFPSLIVVLQGYGVTVDLVGSTFISHAGITSSTFKQVPDVPITTFDLSLPEGPFSALAANLPPKAHDSFCGQSLKMPTAFVAQNGAEIHESTPIAVTGCPKAKKASKKTANKKPRKGGGKKS